MVTCLKIFIVIIFFGDLKYITFIFSNFENFFIPSCEVIIVILLLFFRYNAKGMCSYDEQ